MKCEYQDENVFLKAEGALSKIKFGTKNKFNHTLKSRSCDNNANKCK